MFAHRERNFRHGHGARNIFFVRLPPVLLFPLAWLHMWQHMLGCRPHRALAALGWVHLAFHSCHARRHVGSTCVPTMANDSPTC